MKRILLPGIIMLLGFTTFAQTDTTLKNNSGDTVLVGNFLIIKNHKEGNTNEDSIPPRRGNYTIINIPQRRSYKAGKPPANISTNYLIFDLGFANYNDKTDYTSPEAIAFADGLQKDDLKLKTGKSSNVNIWLFMQKLNVAKHVINLKYGLGLEMFNYRFKNDISLQDHSPYIFQDSIQFSKDKLYVGYATIPLMLNIKPSPNHKHGL